MQFRYGLFQFGARRLQQPVLRGVLLRQLRVVGAGLSQAGVQLGAQAPVGRAESRQQLPVGGDLLLLIAEAQGQRVAGVGQLRGPGRQILAARRLILLDFPTDGQDPLLLFVARLFGLLAIGGGAAQLFRSLSAVCFCCSSACLTSVSSCSAACRTACAASSRSAFCCCNCCSAAAQAFCSC